MSNEQKEELAKRIESVVESEIIDMSDEFDNGEICEIMRTICEKLIFGWKVSNIALLRELDTHHLYVYTFLNDKVFIYNDEYEKLVGTIKVSNKPEGSFISWSDNENTGVAHSCSALYNDEMDNYEIETILSMVNEAWYNCKK